MASEKAERKQVPGTDETDAGLDQAIDQLRGVLKRDAGPDDASDKLELDDDMTAGSKAAGALDDDFGADFGSASPFGETGLPSLDDDAAVEFEAKFPATIEDEADFGAEFGEPATGAGFSGARALQDAINERMPKASQPATVKSSDTPANFDLIKDIPIEMQIVLGKTRMPVAGLMNLAEGALIGLDRKIGEPVDIMVNGRVFGRGEITVIEGDETRFGVKLLEVIGSKQK